MIELSLTDFVDIVSKAGKPKATNVKKVKHRLPYDPRTDFYKSIREQLEQMHANELPKKIILDFANKISDAKKKDSYTAIATGYMKWMGRKSINWFAPPADKYTFHGVSVRLNPEIGVEVNGEKYLIKLYFKAEKLTANRIELASHMMEIGLRDKVGSDVKMAILDVRNSKLHVPAVPVPMLTATLHAELAYIASLWPEL